MTYSLLEWFSVISLILNFSRLLLIKAGLNRLKLIKATGWHKFNLSRLFSNPARKEKKLDIFWKFFEIFKILKIRDSSFVALLILRHFI